MTRIESVRNCWQHMLEAELKMRKNKIGIVGCGLIGRAWTMLFTSVGYEVILYDIQQGETEKALKIIANDLKELETQKKLRGNLSALEQLACVTVTNKLEEVAQGAFFIQECVPEMIDIKRSLYKQLDALVEEDTIISSSTSTYMPSRFSEGLVHKENILVSHPLNPPYYIPLLEIVPAPWTNPEVVSATRDLMLKIGQKPVILKREVEGFATNRIQYAILCEAWRLVREGILSVADVDRVMADGLGLRYALSGPFETAHLNANGISDYFDKFGKEINAVCATYGPIPIMETGATLTEISKQCEALLPLERLPKKREEREKFLYELSKITK